MRWRTIHDHRGARNCRGRNGTGCDRGGYRIVYEILDEVLVVTVVNVGHRRDVYKGT